MKWKESKELPSWTFQTRLTLRHQPTFWGFPTEAKVISSVGSRADAWKDGTWRRRRVRRVDGFVCFGLLSEGIKGLIQCLGSTKNEIYTYLYLYLQITVGTRNKPFRPLQSFPSNICGSPSWAQKINSCRFSLRCFCYERTSGDSKISKNSIKHPESKC